MTTLHTNHRLWILGPDEQEVRAVEDLLRATNQPFVYGMKDRTRVGPDSRFEVEQLSAGVSFAPAGVPVTLYAVRCDVGPWAEKTRMYPHPLVVRIDDTGTAEGVLRAIEDGTEAHRIHLQWHQLEAAHHRKEMIQTALITLGWVAIYSVSLRLAGAWAAATSMLVACASLVFLAQYHARTDPLRYNRRFGDLLQQNPWLGGFAVASGAIGAAWLLWMAIV